MGDIDQTTPQPEGGESQEPIWLEQVSKDLRYDYLKEAPDLNDFVKKHDEMKKELDEVKSGNYVKVPGEEAGKREINSFRKALGIPNSPDGYEFAMDNLPEGVSFSEEEINGYKDFALKNNLTPKQANAFLEYEVNRRASQQESSLQELQQEASKTKEILEGIYGDKFEERYELTQRMIDKIGGEKLREEFDRNGLGNTPELAKLMFKIAPYFNDGSFTFGSGGSVGGEDEGPDFDSLYPSMRNHPDRR